jgi:hypothetical protein
MTPIIQTKIAMWFIHGKVGLSSKTMASWLGFSEKFEDGQNYPHDPDDLDRCLQLLNFVPELRIFLPNMAVLSPVWKALIESWDEIENSHINEVGLGWSKNRSAPATYYLMRNIIENSRKQA